MGVEHWMVCNGGNSDKPIKLRIPRCINGSQTAGAKLRGREGKSPDHHLRSPNPRSVLKVVIVHRQIGGWLRGSHPLKSV